MKKKPRDKAIKARKKSRGSALLTSDFDSLVASIVQIHDQAQDFAAKAVNVGLTLRNWLIGHRVVEFGQQGSDRRHTVNDCWMFWRRSWLPLA